MEVMIVNGDRYLINETSPAVDLDCQIILAGYPKDAIVEFDGVKHSDLSNNIK